MFRLPRAALSQSAPKQGMFARPDHPLCDPASPKECMRPQKLKRRRELSRPFTECLWWEIVHVLSACRRRLHSGTERDASLDGCSVPQLRVNKQLPINEFKPLFHADETDPSPIYSLIDIETTPRIAHTQLDLIQSAPERHFKALRTTVLHRILEGFLQHTKQAN